MNGKYKSLLSRAAVLVTLLSVLVTALIVPAFATTDGTGEKVDVEAVITPAKGGATGIVSMTYDDGIYDTAVLLNQLFAEYGLEASLMMSSTLGGSANTVERWNALFADGRLEPQSHSMTHTNLHGTNSQTGLPITNGWTNDDYVKEIGGSKTFFENTFPVYDSLTFAVPNSNYNATELAIVGDYFYAARGGACVLNTSSYSGKYQSLNPLIPGVGNTTYSTVGNWYNPYMVRMQPNASVYSETSSAANIISYVERCIANEGWFISLTHGVSDSGDMTEAQAREIFAAMQKYQKAGKLWVAKFSDATKYVRERQNSEASAYSLDGKYYVSVTMGSTTADGLPLTADVFDYPLTVKIEVPRDWTRVSYTLNGEAVNTKCVANGAANYAYVDVVPNTGDVEVTDGTLPEEKDDFYPGKYLLPEGAWDHSTEENLAKYPNILFGVWESENDFELGNPPVLWRSSDPTAQNYSAGLDSNFIGAKDSDGTLYYKFNGNDLSSETASGKTNYTRYVHLYQDATLLAGSASTTQLVTCQNETLILDLGGNSLDMSIGTRLGGSSATHPQSSFTLKNGYANYINGQTQPRPDTTLIYENIDMTMTYTGNFIYDGGANLIEYRNCIVRAKKENSFFLGGGYDSNKEVVNFINTEFVYETVPSQFFIKINEPYDSGKSQLEITFDKNCSFSNIPAEKWFSLTEGFYRGTYKAKTDTKDAYLSLQPESNGVFNTTQKINFEIGVQFKNGASLPDSYTFYDVPYQEAYDACLQASISNGLADGATAADGTWSYVITSGNKSDDRAAINLINPTTGETVTDYWMVYDDTEDSYEVIVDFIGYTMVILDEENKIVTKAWTGASVSASDLQNVNSIKVINPETGELYGGEYCFLYNEETAEYDLVADFSGYDMIAYRDGSLLVGVYSWADGEVLEGVYTEYPKSDGTFNIRYPLNYIPNNAYIKLYNDAEFGNFDTLEGNSVTFDLNGHTFTNSKQTTNIQLGMDQSGTWKEREISFINSSDGPATLDLTSKGGSYFQARPGSIVLFENINIKLKSGYMFNEGGAKSVTFKDCNVSSSGSTYLFESGINPSSYNDFLKNSSDNYREYVIDNTVLDNTGIALLKHSVASYPDRVRVTVKNGSALDNQYSTVQVSVTGTAIDKVVFDIATDTKYTAVYIPSSSFFSVADGLTTPVVDSYYTDIDAGETVAKEDLVPALKGSYHVVVGKNEELIYGYKIATAAGVETLYLADFNDAGNAILTYSAIKKIPEGGTITFLCDLEYDSEGTSDSIGRVNNYANNITVDLNNHTFTLNHRWQLASNCTKFLFKDGRIEAPNQVTSTDAIFFGNAGADSVFTFENVHFEIGGLTPKNNIFQLYTGSLVIKGGSLTTPSGMTAINFPELAFHSLTLDGVEADVGVLVSKNYKAGTQNTYTIKGCDITVANSAFRIGSGTFAGGANDYVNINVTNSKIRGELFGGNNNITSPFFNISLSETYLSKAPTVIETQATLSYGENQLLMGIVDPANEGYTYLVSANKPAVGNNLQVNLTLMTNFDLNFFANPEAVLGVYCNGELLASIVWENSVKYTASFAAHEAADAREFEVWVKSGDVTYKIPLNYSVLTYAEDLVADGEKSNESKALAKAAIAYVKEAYAVAGIALPEELAAFNSTVAEKSAGEAQLPETLTKAILSVQFKLESSVNLVLKIADTYNGTVTVNSVVYEVSAGDVLNIPLRAKELAGDINVTAGTESATLTLAGYVNSDAVQGSNMEALVEALYTYAAYAKEYADYVASSGGIMN